MSQVGEVKDASDRGVQVGSDGSLVNISHAGGVLSLNFKGAQELAKLLDKSIPAYVKEQEKAAAEADAGYEAQPAAASEDAQPSEGAEPGAEGTEETPDDESGDEDVDESTDEDADDTGTPKKKKTKKRRW